MDPEDIILENVGSKSINTRLFLTVIVYTSLMASILLGQYYIFEYRAFVIVPIMLAFPKITNFMTQFIAFDSQQSLEFYEFVSKFLQRFVLLAIPDLLKTDKIFNQLPIMVAISFLEQILMFEASIHLAVNLVVLFYGFQMPLLFLIAFVGNLIIYKCKELKNVN